jgi:hypothetical protein
MARYNSGTTEEPGQYPTTTWSEYGLPEQNFGTGAAGTTRPSSVQDEGDTNEPGQYPDRDSFTGEPYSLGGTSGSGAPGTAGAPYDGVGAGRDTVEYSKPTFYKGQRDPGGNEPGYTSVTASGNVNGPGDWTEANSAGYDAPAQFQMPGVAGNTPTPGSGQFQTDGGNGSSHVMYGGFLRGDRPSTSRHPNFSGPGT